MNSQSQSLQEVLYSLYENTELNLEDGAKIHKVIKENIKKSQDEF